MNALPRGRKPGTARTRLAIGMTVLSFGMQLVSVSRALPIMAAIPPSGPRSAPVDAPASCPLVGTSCGTPAASGPQSDVPDGVLTGDFLPVVLKSLPAATTSTTLSPGLSMQQPTAIPSDVLGSPNGLACNGPTLTLDGQAQTACGPIAPVVVTNNGGTTLGWTLTGQVSDFNDPAAPSVTCDTIATYNNHCIPGGDMGWIPYAHLDIALSGTNAMVQPGPLIDTSGTFPAGSSVSPPPGLSAAPQVLCQAPANLSQGQFTCGADVVLPVPASVAVPAFPGYQATLTLTLS